MVRVGATVRKPATMVTPAVRALLDHLSGVGFDGAPRHLGLDDRGRQVLEFVPGTPADRLPPLDLRELEQLGRPVRRLHDATAGFVPPERSTDRAGGRSSTATGSPTRSVAR